MNMLEMTMALAFHSLPQAVLEKYLPSHLIPTKHPTIHLNVAIPLLQTAGLNRLARDAARAGVSSSADPQVRSWTAFRNKHLSNQKSRNANVGARPLRSDFLGAFKASISTVDPELDLGTFLCQDMDSTLPLGADFSVKDQIEACATSILAESGHKVPLSMPIGSPRRSIAIILGQPSRQREDDASVALDQRLPFGLQASGLSAENSLI